MIGNLQTLQTLKNITKISEDAQQPIHVPIFLNGECFVVTTQKVKQTVEDLRLVSYCKIMPNGQVISMESLGNDINARTAVLQAFQQQYQQIISSPFGVDSMSLTLNQLAEFLNRLCGNSGGAFGNLQMQSPNAAPPIVGMELDDQQQTLTNVASVEQQLQWSKVHNSLAPFPLHCSKSTSTSEISRSSSCNQQSSKSTNISDDNFRKVCSVTFASDTDRSAREQLKDKKQCSKTEFSYIS